MLTDTTAHELDGIYPAWPVHERPDQQQQHVYGHKPQHPAYELSEQHEMTWYKRGHVFLRVVWEILRLMTVGVGIFGILDVVLMMTLNKVALFS